LTTTNAATKTFAGAGIAVGFAAATAVAEGTTAAAPYTDATTNWLVDGGFITSLHTGHMSIDFPYGPTSYRRILVTEGFRRQRFELAI
jgi:hypothetical protein